MTKQVKIVIEIDGEQRTLTLEEAKALHDQLGQLFPDKPYVHPHHPLPYSPCPSVPGPWDPYQPWITCDDQTQRFTDG